MDSSQYLLPKYRHLKKEYDAVTQCNRCGFCETVCPTYVASGKETLSPRGRNQALRQILEGKLDKPHNALEIFTTCLTCHACTNACFSQVPVGKLMAEARNIATANDASRPLMFAVMRVTLKRRKILSTLLWISFFFKRIGVSALLNKLGILGLISQELEAGDELVHQTPWKFGASVTPRGKALPNAKKTAYFSGCGIHYLYPDASKACAQTLEQFSDAQFPNHSCCGLPAQSQGDVEGAKELAKKNIEQFSKLEADWIVVNDGSCAGIMKNYGELLNGDPKAIEFSSKIKTFSEFLSSVKEMGLNDFSHHAAGKGGQKVRVVYHDPCQVGNGQNIYEPARSVLKGNMSVHFSEMEEANACCGGAGTYCVKHPRLAEDVLERKIENIVKSGAEIILTEASSCLLHVEYGLRKKGLGQKIRIMHLAQFFEK